MYSNMYSSINHDDDHNYNDNDTDNDNDNDNIVLTITIDNNSISIYDIHSKPENQVEPAFDILSCEEPA